MRKYIKLRRTDPEVRKLEILKDREYKATMLAKRSADEQKKYLDATRERVAKCRQRRREKKLAHKEEDDKP